MESLSTELQERVRSLIPINALIAQHQADLVNHGEVLTIRKRQFVFKQGERDAYQYFLLEGELELDASGQLMKTLVGGTDAAKHPMAQLQPRQLSAKAKTAITVLKVDREMLDRLLNLNSTHSGLSRGVANFDVDGDDDDGAEEIDWMSRMLESELFARIPPMNIHQVFAYIEEVPVTKGQVIITQGTPGDFYYVIQHGLCDVTRAAGSGKTVKLADLSDGDSFGEESLVSNTKRNANVTMTTDGVLMQLTKEHFIELIKKPSMTVVNYEQGCNLVTEGASWVDVRFPGEYDAAHIEGSQNLPLSHLRMRLDKLDKDAKYIICCDSGARSASATFLLLQSGFDAVLLEGGLLTTDVLAERPTAAPQAAAPAPPPVAKTESARNTPPRPARRNRRRRLKPPPLRHRQTRF